MLTKNLLVIFCCLVIGNCENVKKRFLKFYPQYAATTQKAITELKFLAASLDKDYKSEVQMNALRSALNMASLGYPPIRMASFAFSMVSYGFQKYGHSHAVDDVDQMQTVLHYFLKENEEMEDLVNQLDANNRPAFDFERLKQKTAEAKQILNRIFIPVIEVTFPKEIQSFILENLSVLFANVFANADENIVKDMSTLTDDKLLSLSNYFQKVISDMSKREGFAYLIKLLHGNDLDSMVKQVALSPYFRVFMFAWKSNKGILEALKEGFDSFHAWIILTPEIPMTGNAALMFINSKYMQNIEKHLSDRVKGVIKSNAFKTGLAKLCFVYESYSLYRSGEVLYNGAKTKQSKTIYRLVEVFEKDLEEKEKIYNKYIDSL